MKFLTSALVAAMISCSAGSALAAHAANHTYYLGIDAPTDMPRPTPQDASPGGPYLWSCNTNAKGEFETTLLSLKKVCEYRFDPRLASVPASAPAAQQQPQLAAAQAPFTKCYPQKDAICEMRFDWVPRTAEGKSDPLYVLIQGSCNGITCKYWNTRLPKPEVRLELTAITTIVEIACTDPEKPYPYKGACYNEHQRKFLRKMETPRMVYVSSDSYYSPGILIGVGSYPYNRVLPSASQSPSYLSSGGCYQRCKGQSSCHC